MGNTVGFVDESVGGRVIAEVVFSIHKVWHGILDSLLAMLPINE